MLWSFARSPLTTRTRAGSTGGWGGSAVVGRSTAVSGVVLSGRSWYQRTPAATTRQERRLSTSSITAQRPRRGLRLCLLRIPAGPLEADSRGGQGRRTYP